MSVANGKAKYASKVPIMAEKWNAAKGRMLPAYQAGLAGAGAPPGPLTSQAYQQGIARATFSVPADAPDKWERHFRDAISR